MKTLTGTLASLAVLLLVSGVFAQTPAPPLAPPTDGMSQTDREIQQLLAKLTELGNLIAREPRAWQHQITQADVVLHLAVRCKGKERDDWLHMAADSLYVAAVQAPENEMVYQRLKQLPTQIIRAYPESKAWSHAAWQEIQADYMRMMGKPGTDPTRAQMHLRDRLLIFVGEHPQAPDAARAVLEVANLSEKLGRKDEARQCYAYLAEHYPASPQAKKAGALAWRMGEGKSEVTLSLPYLYAASDQGPEMYRLKEARGKLVVMYFWTKNCQTVQADLGALKQLKEHYRDQSVEIVYVNLDENGSDAREYLSGKLLPGLHLHQRGGLQSEVATTFGIKTLPEAIVISRDGVLLRHSLKVNELREVVAGALTRGQ